MVLVTGEAVSGVIFFAMAFDSSAARRSLVEILVTATFFGFFEVLNRRCGRSRRE
jgi:hypothetical protein